MSELFPRVAFIGVGTMAEAMVERAMAGGWPRERLVLSHRREDRRRELAGRFGGDIEPDNVAAAGKGDLVVVGVRPQEFEAVLATLRPGFKAGQTLVSIAAALTIPWLRNRLPAGMRIIRVTPPPTAWVGAGVTLLSTEEALEPAEKAAIERLVKAASERVEWVLDELMEPITAAALGLTPYTCMLLRTLIRAAVEQGVGEPLIRKMVVEGLLATAKLLSEGGFSPEQVIDMVATREGLTWSALHTMEAYNVPAGIRAGVRAMTARSYELRGERVPDDYTGFLR